jgi:CheY-like chemotaxis protein
MMMETGPTKSGEIRVLLAEPNVADIRRFVGAMGDAGWVVSPAADVVSAQAVARRQHFDVAVVDVRLPGGGGIRALRRLRTALNTAVVPAVALADTDAEHGELTEAGAQICLTKPVAEGALMGAIREARGLTLAPVTAPAHAVASPERLQSVRKSGLLDTPAEPEFDLLTRLAATLLHAPTALLSIVDSDRQFFKSSIGVGEPWLSARETPLSHSFCQWVVVSGETFVVNDAGQHPLVRHNLAVRDLSVAAYAGVPVQNAGSEPIGSFCVVDTHARTWSDDELTMLQDLAAVAQAEMAVRQADSPRPEQLARGVTAILHLLASCGGRLADDERDGLVKLGEAHAKRLASHRQ